MSEAMYGIVGVLVAMIFVAIPVAWMAWWLFADLAGGPGETPSYAAIEQRRQRAA